MCALEVLLREGSKRHFFGECLSFFFLGFAAAVVGPWGFGLLAFEEHHHLFAWDLLAFFYA